MKATNNERDIIVTKIGIKLHFLVGVLSVKFQYFKNG